MSSRNLAGGASSRSVQNFKRAVPSNAASNRTFFPSPTVPHPVPHPAARVAPAPRAPAPRAPPAPHAHLILLLLTLLALFALTSLLFNLTASIYLLLFLHLTPLTFSPYSPLRTKRILATLNFLFVYATSLAVLSLLVQILPLILNIPLPTATLEILSTAGFDLYPHINLTFLPIISIFFPHLLLSVLSFFTHDYWAIKSERDIRSPIQNLAPNNAGGLLQRGLLQRSSLLPPRGNLNTHRHLSPLWLCTFTLSLSFSCAINPSLLTFPLYIYTLLLFLSETFNPKLLRTPSSGASARDNSAKNTSLLFSPTSLSVLSVFASSLLFLSYVYQFTLVNEFLNRVIPHSSDVEDGQLFMDHYIGLVFFKEARSVGYFFEYIQMAALALLHLLSASKANALNSAGDISISSPSKKSAGPVNASPAGTDEIPASPIRISTEREEKEEEDGERSEKEGRKRGWLKATGTRATARERMSESEIRSKRPARQAARTRPSVFTPVVACDRLARSKKKGESEAGSKRPARQRKHGLLSSHRLSRSNTRYAFGRRGGP